MAWQSVSIIFSLICSQCPLIEFGTRFFHLPLTPTTPLRKAYMISVRTTWSFPVILKSFQTHRFPSIPTKSHRHVTCAVGDLAWVSVPLLLLQKSTVLLHTNTSTHSVPHHQGTDVSYEVMGGSKFIVFCLFLQDQGMCMSFHFLHYTLCTSPLVPKPYDAPLQRASCNTLQVPNQTSDSERYPVGISSMSSWVLWYLQWTSVSVSRIFLGAP